MSHNLFIIMSHKNQKFIDDLDVNLPKLRVKASKFIQ